MRSGDRVGRCEASIVRACRYGSPPGRCATTLPIKGRENANPYRNGGSSKARSLRECRRLPSARNRSMAWMPI